MKFTNKFNIPSPLADLLVRNDKRPDPASRRISVTTLTDSPQIKRLMAEHWDELEYDISDNLFMLQGSILHDVIARKSDDLTQVAEEKSTVEIDDWTVVGKLDLRLKNGKTLIDWKYCSTWAVMLPSEKLAWVAQLNVYDYLLHRNGIEVESLVNWLMFRDFLQSKAKTDLEYPACGFMEYPVKRWPRDEQERYIKGRLAIHGDPAAPCSDDERWARPAKYAVMFDKNKTATRVFDSDPEAQAYIQMMLDVKRAKYRVDFRPGEFKRCEKCIVNRFCPQFKQTT